MFSCSLDHFVQKRLQFHLILLYSCLRNIFEVQGNLLSVQAQCSFLVVQGQMLLLSAYLQENNNLQGCEEASWDNKSLPVHAEISNGHELFTLLTCSRFSSLQSPIEKSPRKILFSVSVWSCCSRGRKEDQRCALTSPVLQLHLVGWLANYITYDKREENGLRVFVRLTTCTQKSFPKSPSCM